MATRSISADMPASIVTTTSIIDTFDMKTPNIYKRRRFPAEIIQHAVWLYFRFALSFHKIKDQFAERGIIVSYETPSAAGVAAMVPHMPDESERGTVVRVISGSLTRSSSASPRQPHNWLPGLR